MIIKEHLFRIEGKKGYYTKAYCEANNHPIARGINHNDEVAHCIPWISSKKVINVHDVNTDRTAYLFGEHTFFWTEEEREIHKAERNAELILAGAKNDVIRAIKEKMDGMTLEEVQALLTTI